VERVLSYTDRARRYADDVLGGEIVAGEYVRKACERFVGDYDANGTGPYMFAPEKADAVCRFVENLRHVKGKWGRERLKISLEDWQVFILANVFGWLKREDGLRRFLSAYSETGRKNAKTTKSSGVALYMLTADDEAGAEVYSAATKKDQAKIVFEISQQQARRDEQFREHFGLEVGAHAITCRDTFSKYLALASEGDTLDGLNPSCVIADEMHAHKTQEVLDVLRSGMGAREQPLLWEITTAGIYRPESVGWKEHTYALNVLDGTFTDDTHFAYVAALDKGDEWSDPEVWPKANPNLGVSVFPTFLEKEANAAQNEPSKLNEFLRKHADIWTEQVERWLPMEQWLACGGSVNEAELIGVPSWAGLDLAVSKDLTAFVMVFPVGDKFKVVCRFWCPEHDIERRSKTDRVPYRRWVDEGWIKATPGASTDHEVVEQDIIELCRRFAIREVGYDPWIAEPMAQRLAKAGIRLEKMRQGTANLNYPSKKLEGLVADGDLEHGNNPVLRWMASNVTIRTDANDAIMPDKKRSSEKVDGIVALIMALGRATVSGPQPAGWLLNTE
jgi:phage terminase large subunit-like protein